MKRGYILMLTMAIACNCFAQTIIKGSVTTTNGEALPFANVYVNTTSIGSTTDTNGQFEFILDLEGKITFICSFTGFHSATVEKEIGADGELTINFRLKENITSLDEVAIQTKRPKDWQKNLKKFESHFLGSREMMKSCEITNSYVLDFEVQEGRLLRASGNEPLIISNRFLGYEINYDLKSFWVDLKTGQMEYKGYTYFTDLEAQSKEEEEQWIENRKEAYFGSLPHFLKALSTDSLSENGFNIYVEKKAVKELSMIPSNDLKELTSDAIIKESETGLSLEYKGFLRVENEKRKSYQIFNGRSRAVNETSWIELRKGKASLNKKGYATDPLDLISYGAFSRAGIGYSLPIEYDPGKPQRNVVIVDQDKRRFLENLLVYDSINQRERVYLAFDSDEEFRPGLNFSFEAFVTTITHKTPLSQVLYVELIGPQCEPIIFKKVQLINGKGSGSFILPSTLYSGRYILRAYTAWMRNFDHSLFYKNVIQLGNSISKEATSLKFFPEYGYLYNDEKNNLMIRTTNREGISVPGFVRIFDDRDKLITEVKTDASGVGAIRGMKVEDENNYYALLEGSSLRWSLPKGISRDVKFDMTEGKESVLINLQNTAKQTRKILIANQGSGLFNFIRRYNLYPKETLKVEISKNKLRDGMNQLSILSESYESLGSKYIFVNRESSEGSDSPLNRVAEYIKFKSSLTDFSDRGFEDFSNTSELNQFIGSHSWNSMDYKSIFDSTFTPLPFAREYGLTISGKLQLNESKLSEDESLNLLVKSTTPQFLETTVSPSGDFRFTNVNYNDTTDLIFSYGDLAGSAFEIVFDTFDINNVFPRIEDYCFQSDSSFTFSEQALSFGSEATLLKEVTVIAKKQIKTDRLYREPTKSYELGGLETTRIIASGGLLRYVQTRVGSAQLLRDQFTGEVTGIILGGITSFDASKDEALLIYDGIQMDATRFDELDPSFIGRIDILTGTDAAIFGSRGSSGVIIAYPAELKDIPSKVKTYQLSEGFDVSSD